MEVSRCSRSCIQPQHGPYPSLERNHRYLVHLDSSGRYSREVGSNQVRFPVRGTSENDLRYHRDPTESEKVRFSFLNPYPIWSQFHEIVYCDFRNPQECLISPNHPQWDWHQSHRLWDLQRPQLSEEPHRPHTINRTSLTSPSEVGFIRITSLLRMGLTTLSE